MFLDARMVFTRTMEYKYCTGPTTSHTPYKIVHIKWNPPTMGNYKLNTNDSFLDKERMGGLGGIIRNSTGEWILGYNKKAFVLIIPIQNY